MKKISDIFKTADEIYPDSDSEKYKKKFIREEILNNGSVYKGIWLNKKYSVDFIAKATASKAIGRDGFLWLNKDGDVVYITNEKANEFISVILNKLDKLYIGKTYDEYKKTIS